MPNFDDLHILIMLQFLHGNLMKEETKQNMLICAKLRNIDDTKLRY